MTNASIDGIWLTCADLAQRRGISRQAATKRVDQLERDGKLTTRREGRSRLVDLAAFDRAVGETGDAFREQSAETAREQRAATPGMRDAQTLKAQYEARLKALDLGEREKQLLPIAGEHGVASAAERIGIAMARDVDGLIRYADEIATAVSKEGVSGARRVLKDVARQIRQSMSASLARLAAEGRAAETAGPIETDLADT